MIVVPSYNYYVDKYNRIIFQDYLKKSNRSTKKLSIYNKFQNIVQGWFNLFCVQKMSLQLISVSICVSVDGNLIVKRFDRRVFSVTGFSNVGNNKMLPVSMHLLPRGIWRAQFLLRGLPPLSPCSFHFPGWQL